MEVGGQQHAPAALPLGKIRHPLVRTLGGPQVRSGRVRKISPQQGFDPRTVQPVASHYTHWAIQDRILTVLSVKQIYVKFYVRMTVHRNRLKCIKPTDALNSSFIGITTLHVSGSLPAHHQEFWAVHWLWYILLVLLLYMFRAASLPIIRSS